MFCPDMPKLLYTWVSLRVPPSVTSELSTVKDGTGGRKS